MPLANTLIKTQITVSVPALRPTQITVPLARVEQKRAQLRGARGRQLDDFLNWHTMPAVLGPDLAVYLIGDHTVARALAEEHVDSCVVTVQRDLSRVTKAAFWLMMEREGWAHPFDELGRRRSYSCIPRALRDMVDDPYRNLVAEVRDYGAIADGINVAAEYAWANYLRPHIDRDLMRQDYPEARKRALAHVRSQVARRIPGWRAAT